MKPRFAKELTAPKIIPKREWNTEKREYENHPTETEKVVLANPINNTLDSINCAKTLYWWKGLRWIIESIEAAGYKVSITKDGKEYNQ